MLDLDKLKVTLTIGEFRLISMALSGVLLPRDEPAAKALSTRLLKAKADRLRVALETTEGALRKSKDEDPQQK